MEVLPNKVHRVIYEDMVENTEVEIRKLLDFCELEFEEDCLNFLKPREQLELQVQNKLDNQYIKKEWVNGNILNLG